jgi:protein-S-isoprenylcysteine O-methyltransferase Ste14
MLINDYKDRPNTIHWPPALYLMALAGAYVLQKIVPIPTWIPQPYANQIGWPLFFFGVLLGCVAIFGFRQHRTPVDPTARAERLATDGIYAVTRNPMYLCAIIALVGVGIARGSSWLLVITCVLPLALRRLAIDREEAHLESRFGDDYRRYKSRVRRWL